MKTMMNAVVALTVLCASTFGAPLSKEKRVSTFSIALELWLPLFTEVIDTDFIMIASL